MKTSNPAGTTEFAYIPPREALVQTMLEIRSATNALIKARAHVQGSEIKSRDAVEKALLVTVLELGKALDILAREVDIRVRELN